MSEHEHVWNYPYLGETTASCEICGIDKEQWMLDRIAELEERLTETDQALSREARECGAWRRQAEAAMAIVRAVADLILYAHDDGDTYDARTVARLRDQSVALLASATGAATREETWK